MNETMSFLSNPVNWLNTGSLIQFAVVLSVFWIVLQILPNRFAGGKLFERKGMWITTAIAGAVVSVFVFFGMIWPLVSGLLPLVFGLVIIAVIIIVVLVIKRRVH